MPNRIASFDQWLADWWRLVKHFIYLQCLGICSQTALYLQTPPGHTCAAPISWWRPYFNTTYSILYDHPPSHSLTLSSGCPKCKRSACEPINGHERCRKSGCYIMQLLYDVCMKWYNFLSCIINLNIIYLLKTMVWESVYEWGLIAKIRQCV